METKKLMAPRDGLLLLGLLLLAGILFLVLGNRPQGAAAIVERDGEILCRQELSALAAPVELEFEGEGGAPGHPADFAGGRVFSCVHLP